MKKALIRQGDPTSHGGVVLEGHERVRALGQPVASKGHLTYCPACRGNFPIAEGVPKLTAFGTHVAVDGMKTECGATLIATQHSVNIVIDGASQLSSSGPGDSSQQRTDRPSNALQQGSDAANLVYSGRFRAMDDATAAPIAGLGYLVEFPDGRCIRGKTDAEGYTERICSDSPHEVHLHWIADLSPESTDDSAGGIIC